MDSILVEGNFGHRDIEILKLEKSARYTDDELEKLAKREWQNKLKEAQREDKRLWDSSIYRLDDFKKDRANLTLSVSTIPFSIRIGMNSLTDLLKRKGKNYFPMALFSSTYLKTSDDKFVFIEKSDNYYSRRKYSFVGGVLSSHEASTINGTAIFRQLAKEIFEETGAKTKLDSIKLKSIYINKTGNCCLLFDSSANISSLELLKAFANIPGAKEASQLIFFERDRLQDFVINEVGFDKSAVKAISRLG